MRVRSRWHFFMILFFIKTFEFIVCLVVAERCVNCTEPLMLQLQSVSLDAGKAREKVAFLFLTINELRSDVDKDHEVYYEMAVQQAEGGGLKAFKERTSDRHMHRNNVPTESTAEYFKRAVTIPFLDQLVGQIQSRFSEGNVDAFDVMYALPSYVTSEPEWAEHFHVSSKSTKTTCQNPTSLKWSKECGNCFV